MAEGLEATLPRLGCTNKPIILLENAPLEVVESLGYLGSTVTSNRLRSGHGMPGKRDYEIPSIYAVFYSFYAFYISPGETK